MNKTLAIATLKRGQCECGVEYFVMAERALAEGLSQRIEANDNEEPVIDIFICGDKVGICSTCGAKIPLPVSELLDPIRTEIGQWHQRTFEKSDHE
jgi:hypothetical protein